MAISELPKPKPAKKGPTCLTCSALRDLPKAEADALREHLSNTAWRYTALAEAIRNDPDVNLPYDLPDHSLARHARGGCDVHEKLR